MTHEHAPARPFNQSWSLADTQSLLDQAPFPQDATPGQQEQWREQVGRPGDRKLAGAIGEHIAWLMGQGVEIIPENCRAIRTRFLDALRELAMQPGDTGCHVDAGMVLVNHMAVYAAIHHGNDGVEAGQVHEKLQEVVCAGDFKAITGDDQACHDTGLRVSMNTHGWKGELGTRKLVPDPDRAWGRFVFEPLDYAAIQVSGTQTCTIPVPSGQLWIADWFRIQAFNDLARPVDDDEPGHALESTAGRAARASRYAKALGVGHVFGRSPAIVASRGAITAGYLGRDADTGEEIEPAGYAGSVSADLRWISVVDRQHLVDLLASAVGGDEAAKIVDDYEASNPQMLKISMDPGIAHLYFAGDPATLGKTIDRQFESQGLYLEEDYIEPVFALTSQPLRMKHAPVRKAGPGGP